MTHVGEVAVITGGAGGIGIACAEMWIAEGGLVVACDVNDAKGEAFAIKYPGKVKYLHCDTTNNSDLEAAAMAAKSMGAFTCWFNNAGGGSPNDTLKSALNHIAGDLIDFTDKSGR